MYLLATNYFQEILKMESIYLIFKPNTNQQCFDQIPNHADNRSAETRKHADRCAEISAEKRKNFKDSIPYPSPPRLIRTLANPNLPKNTSEAIGKFTRMEMLKSLVENDDINIKVHGSAGLMVADIENSLEIVKSLVELGVDVNVIVYEHHGTTILMHAVHLNHSQIVVTFLLERGADVNAQNSSGLTPLMIAADDQNMQMVTLLVKFKANIDNAQDKEGKTVLIRAVINNKLDTVKSLVELKADLDARDSSGLTPLMHAVKNKNLKMVNFLLKSGANINAQDNNGKTAMSYAQHTEIIKSLCSKLENGIDKTAQFNPESLLCILPKNNISSVDNNLRKILKDNIPNLMYEVRLKGSRIRNLDTDEMRHYTESLIVLANLAVFDIPDHTDKETIKNSIKFAAANSVFINKLHNFYKNTSPNTVNRMCYIGFLMILTKLGFFNIWSYDIVTQIKKNGTESVLVQIMFEDKKSGKISTVDLDPELEEYALDFLMMLNSPENFYLNPYPLTLLAKNVIKKNNIAVRSLPEPFQRYMKQPQDIIKNIEILRGSRSDSF